MAIAYLPTLKPNRDKWEDNFKNRDIPEFPIFYYRLLQKKGHTVKSLSPPPPRFVVKIWTIPIK